LQSLLSRATVECIFLRCSRIIFLTPESQDSGCFLLMTVMSRERKTGLQLKKKKHSEILCSFYRLKTKEQLKGKSNECPFSKYAWHPAKPYSTALMISCIRKS